MINLKLLFLKYRIKIASAITILLSAILLLSLFYVIEINVSSNDECLWVPIKSDNSEIIIEFQAVKINGVAYNAGIRNGDQLLEISGEKIDETLRAQEILNRVDAGKYADYKIRKPSGEIISTKVYIKKLIQFGSLAQVLSSFILLLIGFIVYTAKPEGIAQRLFFAIGILSALPNLNWFFPLTGDAVLKFIQHSPLLSAVMGELIVFGFSASPVILLYFVWAFPSQLKIFKLKWLRIVFILLVISSMFISLSLFHNIGIENKFDAKNLNTFFAVIRLFNILGSIAAFISLIIQYRLIPKTENRKPILIFIIAFLFGFIIQFYVGTIAPAISDTIFNSPEYYTPILLLVLVPVMFAYAIFKYHLLDVSIVVKNTITYGVATASVAGIYFLLVYLMGQGISRAIGSENQGIIAGVFFLIFAFVFQSTKDKFQDFLTRRFYPEQFAYQKVLIKFSNDISIVAGLDRILDLTKDTFVDALQIKKFGILLRDFDSDELKLVREIGFRNSECLIKKYFISSFIGEKSLIINNPVIIQQDFQKVFPENFSILVQEEIFTVVPMIVKSKVIGCLMFGLKYSGSQFGGKDIELLYAAANQIAISVENARLYESENEKLKLDKELDLARKIQQGLLPKCVPNLRGLDLCGEMIPAMQVGGDYYDLIQISDTKSFVTVGDVSGKGFSAALYMTKLQTMMQLACAKSLSPREILIEINKQLYESMERNWFVTITLALFDVEKQTVKFCRAGHMPLLVAFNDTVESIKTQGLGLGLEKGDIFSRTLVEVEKEYKSGQIFAFFSDGITEAMNDKNELFGEDRLTELLKSKTKIHSSEIMNLVWDEIKKFKGSALPNDDLTMVIVKVN
jgi:serine phosphatase RsbU (regulator of sigma subunit)/uncharacterized membrane protein